MFGFWGSYCSCCAFYPSPRPVHYSSHHIYEYEEGNVWKQVIVPLHDRKVKKIYVKKVVEAIDELFPEEADDEDENDDDKDVE